MDENKVKIGGAFYVPLRVVKQITGYGASNVHRLWKKGDIERVKRGATHLYKLDDVEKIMGRVEHDDEV